MLIIDYQQNLQAPTNYFVLSITSEVKFNKSLQKKKVSNWETHTPRT